MATIRPAEKRDIPGIKKLLEQVLAVHNKGRPDIFKEIGQKYTDEELAELMKKSEDPIFVYKDEGQILGHCFCQTIMHKETPATYEYKTLYIDDLCVEEKARGKHVGTKLYEHAKDFAKKNGYFNVTLHAWECNPEAVGFYQHLGMITQQYTMEEVL